MAHGWPIVEALALLALASSVCVALMTPTPILLFDALDGENKVWPIYSPELNPPMIGALRVVSRPPFGCIEVRTAQGAASAVACHRHFACTGETRLSDRAAPFRIYKPDKQENYFISVCSRCDSVCCDCLATAVSPEGARVDDSLFDRVWNRVHIGWCAAAFALFYAVRQRVRSRRSLRMQLGFVLGMAIPIWLLWRWL